MEESHKARMHAQTLSELNHCVGTARRDAAYACLRQLAEQSSWPQDRKERAAVYRRCLELAQEVLDTSVRYSLMYCNPKQSLWDKPVIHFLHMLQQLLQTLNAMAEHVGNVQSEAEVLQEHLGTEVYSVLASTCEDFERHERVAEYALRKTLSVGQMLVEKNSAKRRELFTADDERRYRKTYGEYLLHFQTNQTYPGAGASGQPTTRTQERNEP
ncbi:MAG: hypothetical protein IJJ26_07815 [Victivallales bacterium]|nr:hypothetical protein [Victivallales bacterium]